MSAETKIYGVATGNGNNGVSHVYADYYVRTDDPWMLATAAAIDSFKPGFGEAVSKALCVDGDENYTISATILSEGDVTGEYPCGRCGEIGEACECEDGPDYDFDESAFFILEVFPENQDWINERSCTVYDSIDDALNAEAVTLAKTMGS